TCHLPSAKKDPKHLDEFPHNPFGDRLRRLGEEFERAAKPKDIASRLKAVANEDADKDGVANELELLLGTNPGDPSSTPSKEQLRSTAKRQAEFEAFLASYRWRPFETVHRPPIPAVKR